MGKYKIAVIVAGIDETYQSSILRGLESAAEAYLLDLYVFVSFSGVMNNAIHDAGELNIFDLPDFKDFDGAVLLTNTIEYQPAVNGILGRIYDAGIPAVSIDNDVANMMSIGIDNKTAMREMTEHFIEKHGFTKFNYISGPADNPESAARLEAFLDVLREHDLYIEKSRIYYGDFRARSGQEAIDNFIANTPDMPQAIICSNDLMASAAINRLYERGYKVPDQIAVSGFDNIYKNHDNSLDLTTVERPLFESGQLACEMLFNRLNGIEQEDRRTLNSAPIFTESCGCDDHHEPVDYKVLNNRNFRRIENSNRYLSLFNKLSRDLQSCETFEDYTRELKRFIRFMDPEEFYFCVCEHWADEFVDDHGIVKKDERISTDYTENVYAAIAYSGGKFYDGITFRTRSLLPDVPRNGGAGTVYHFLPLHFGERCLGYMVINKCPVTIYHTMFQSWCNTINNSLENIRKLICLDFAIKKLGNMYARDTFTGIFNRNGFVQETSDKFAECARDGKTVMLMFIDLDGLKVINDTYGHDVGDYAIRSIADVLRESCINGEVFCRFGGDEFIVFAANFNDDDARRLTESIEEHIAMSNKENHDSFTLSASTGYVIAQPKKEDDLFRFVTDADKVMYEQKRKKKRSNYLKSQ